MKSSKPLPSVSYIVPARNEAGTIALIVESLPALGSASEIIFIENGSWDDTWAVIQRVAKAYTGPHTIVYERITCRGKVEATMRGFELATNDICIIYDADMTVPPDDIPPFYAALRSERGTLINGTRHIHAMEHHAMRQLNRFGNRLFPRILNYLLNLELTDTLCGTKALWREEYEKIRGTHEWYSRLDPFGDFNLLVGACRTGMRIVEIPVHYKARVYGKTNIKRLRNGAQLMCMLLVLSVERYILQRALWRSRIASRYTTSV